MTNWAEAVSLICPKCGACNRPKATIIEVDGKIAICGVCSHTWPVRT